MTDGSPEFHEGYSNPAALEDGVVDFPFHEIDGEEAEESPYKAPSYGMLKAFVEVIAGDRRAPGYLEQVRMRYGHLCIKAGLGDEEPDWEWARYLAGSNEGAEILLLALQEVLPILQTGRGQTHRPFTADMGKLHRALRNKVAFNTIAFVWLMAPAAVDGLSVKGLAEEIGIHQNTLSIYTAELSRKFQYRIHAQAKGHNWQAHKATA